MTSFNSTAIAGELAGMAKSLVASPTIHLQGIGTVSAKMGGDIEVGDILLWNYGYLSEVVNVDDSSASYVTLTLKEMDPYGKPTGSTDKRRVKKDRLVGISDRTRKAGRVAKNPAFKATKSYSQGTSKIEEGKVVIGGTSWLAFKSMAGGKGYMAVSEQRFQPGDRLSMGRGKEDIVAEARSESANGRKVWRYTFAGRGWVRDVLTFSGGEWSDWLKKTGSEDVAPHRQKLEQNIQERGEHLRDRREKRGGKLQQLVADGTLSKGMPVKWRSGRFGGMFLEGEILDFNFDTGRVLVKGTDILNNKRVWVDHIFDMRDKWLYRLT